MEREPYTNQIENQIKMIESKDLDILEKSNKIIALCRMNLSELRSKVLDQGFLNDNDEVFFFKFTKQIPMVNLLYYLEIQDFEANFPINSKNVQETHIRDKTKELNNFFKKHSDLIRYIRLEQTHFDKQYYTRKHVGSFFGKNRLSSILDPTFNTSHDRILAKVTAYQKFSTYLQNRLSQIDKSGQSSSLKWTSTKVSLTELVYALYYSRTINNGNADIKQIAAVFEKAFNFSLGDFYRTYVEIRARKKDRIKFLDELSFTLSNNMKQDDA